MTYPTISITLWEERMPKLEALLEFYRRDHPRISRSEIFWYGIDALYELKCTPKVPEGQSEGQKEAV
jgi:hypothetical protein